MKTYNYSSRLTLFLSLLLISSLTFISCGNDSDDNSNGVDGELNIVETAQESEDFTILAQSIESAGLTAALEGTGPFTVFAPTDAAFEALPEGTLYNLTDDQLAEILQFHVVEGAVASGDLEASQDVQTLLGEEILVESEGGVTINGYSNVATADIEATNGIIHAVDAVLLPEGYREANIIDQANELGNFTTLTSAVEQTGLTSTLKYKGDFTLFAPTDDAFSSLPEGLLQSLSDEQLTEILTYHVLNGEIFAGDLSAEQAVGSLAGGEVFVTANNGNVTINGSSAVVTADVDVSNGVIHAIDEVILPDAYGTVVDAASKRYFFETLVSAVVDAGLADALSNTDASFTVFAPTDAAFEALPDGLLASLTTEQLAQILQYHVLPAEVGSGDLAEAQAPASLTEENVYVTVSDGEVSVNGSATVTAADVFTNNGVVHAIDQVILPNNFQNVVQIASKNYNLSTLVNLVADAGLVSTLEGDGPFTVFAPSNEAFDAVSSTLEGLSSEQVSEVLTYHVAAAEALSGDLQDGMTVSTVQGEDITVNIDGDGNVTLNESVNITTVDLQGTNGVVHIIDGVLLPPSYTSSSSNNQITLNNVGASAWEVTDIQGDGADAPLDTENTEISLTVGQEYTFVNNGGSSHPLEFRNSNGDVLLSEGGSDGTFESDSEINFQVNGNEVSFTLTESLANELASYFCGNHSSMNGSISIQ
ncbi:fasciclin domain-containing protein [Gracilimonas sp.]|uniref:fasciclin domain-containing protein n=1 Tax=Gracilimonas sp. TaxID=1974203 RepID=UPI002871BC6F|nr:fasciclin domain-containing protein [Gracilimonas sp.]